MSKKKIANLIYIFLLLQPIIDLTTALTTRFLNITITLGIIVRGLFLVFMVIYNLFFVKSKYTKKVLYYLASIFIFMIMYFVTKQDIFKFEYIKSEIIYLFKYFYFPIVLVCIINCYDYLEISKERLNKIFVINVVQMSLLILIPYITNTSFSSYGTSGQGVVGWFYSANEVGTIMVALFPYMYYLLFERNSVIKTLFLFIMVITSMTLLGTKTSFLGMLITEILYTLYFLFNYKKNRGIAFKLSLFIILLSFVLIPNIPAVKNLQISISKTNSNIIDISSHESESSKYYDDNDKLEKIFKVALSGRDEFFFRTLNIYKKANISDKTLGLGFVNRDSINNKKIEKLIEIDPLDIFFHYGVLGFILYFLPLIYIIFRIIKFIVKNKFNLSFFKLTNIYVIGIITLISMMAGHVYGAPPVSIYVVFAAAMFSGNLTKEQFEVKESTNNKKITILALHLGYGGVEKYLSSLCKMLEDNYEIEIISTYKVLDKPAFPFSNKIKITYLINDKPNKEELKTAIKEKKIINIFKEGFKSLKILYLKRSRNIKAIRKIYSDYIITTRTFHSRLVGYYALSDITKIATEHNYHNDDKRYIRSVINSVKGFDYFVVVSNNLKKFYENKIGKTRCIYIPNVIDELPNKKSRLTKKNLITIGRLSPEKGQKDLIDVFKIVNNKLPDVKLYIIGDGILKNELEKYVKKLKLNNNIIFTGFLDKEEKEKYILDSSIFVLPSYSESFGLVLIEAMSYGLPCVAFDSSDGAKELLKNNVGILINNRDKNEMAKKIVDVLSSKEINSLGNKGYIYCQKFLIDNIKDDWINLLEKDTKTI